MTKPGSKSARLDDAAVGDARRLLAGMLAEGVETSRDKVIRALLWGVTAPQAVGMLRAYIEHAQAAAEGKADEP